MLWHQNAELTDSQSDEKNDKVNQNQLKVLIIVSESNHNKRLGYGSGFLNEVGCGSGFQNMVGSGSGLRIKV